MKKMYIVVFNSGSPNWSNDAAANRFFTKYTLVHLNDLLKVRGHVFLRDALERFGIPITRESIIGGWVYPEHDRVVLSYHTIGDGPDVKLTFAFEEDILDKL